MSVVLFVCLEPMQVQAQLSCSDCDFVIDKNTGVVNGLDLNVQPGDVIGLAGTPDTYKNLTFNDIVGTEDNPIIIKNCDGQAVISSTGSFGVKFRNSKNFKIEGDGDSEYDYGIKISTTHGFFLTFEQLTTDFEVHSVEIAGLEPYGIGDDNGFAGIGIKTSPYQDCDLFSDPTRTAWIMENIHVHDCYIHDVGGEGLYIGHGFYNGRIESACTDTTWSHSIQHIRIYNNLIEDVAFDGIQIKNADLDCELYNNVIRNYGTLDHGAHNEGLFIGGGTTGKFYNNQVLGGTGHGIQLQGMGNIDIFNNVVVNSGDNSFYASNGVQVYRIPDGYYNIMNNTFVNCGNNGFAFFNNEGGTKRLHNNIIAGAAEDLYRNGAAIDTSHNILTQDIECLDFVDMDNDDYNLLENSKAIGAGLDLSQYGILTDIQGTERSSLYDIGAYQYSVISNVDDTDISLATQLNVFPNPVVDNLIINLKSLEKNLDVKVYNSIGVLMDKFNYKNTRETTLDFSNYQHGFYIVEINNNIIKIIKK